MLTCFLLVGMVASTCGGIRGCSSVDCVVQRFLPDASAWVPVYLVSWALAFGAFCLRQVQAVAASTAPPVLFILSPAWFPRRLRLRGCLTVALAPETEWTFAFGCSFCSVSGSAPSSLVASWCGCLGACLPFVPCLFLWSRCHSRVNGRGAGEVLPIGLFPLSAFEVALPPLWRWRTREAESCGPIRSSGRLPGACSSLSSSPLTLPGVVMTFPVCLPRAPALRQVRVAMLAEGTLESPSVLVLAFHSSLFLVEGSSDGSAPGDRFLSPGRMCSFTPFRLRSVTSALSLLGSGLFFLL